MVLVPETDAVKSFNTSIPSYYVTTKEWIELMLFLCFQIICLFLVVSILALCVTAAPEPGVKANRRGGGGRGGHGHGNLRF